MVPNKLTGASQAKVPAAIINPENHTNGQGSTSTPLTHPDWRRATASMIAGNGNRSPTIRRIVDVDDTDGEDDKSDCDIVEENLNKLTMADEAGVEVTTTPTGRYNTSIQMESKSIVGDGMNKSISSDESKSNKSFGKSVPGSRSDDPFSSAYKPPQRRARRFHSSEGTPTSSRTKLRTQGMWRIEGNSSQNSGSPSRASHEPQTESKPRISGQNAQSHYSPSACIFVANLSSTETETELEAAVTKMFRRYGTVFVKIRRDPKNMPYAFCQFTDDADAAHALEDSRGRLIHGRPVRTERARANRTFSFRRIAGNLVTVEESRAILEQHGTIESVYYPSESQNLVLGLHGAVLVQFAFFDDGRKAQQAIRIDGVYQLDSVANLHQSPQSSGRRAQSRPQRAQDYLREYERDRNSVFVGNLPQESTEAQVRSLFERYGAIVRVEIHRRPSQRNPGQLFSYCFVEYDDPVTPNRAIAAKNNFMLDGHALKVSLKNSEHRSSRSASVGPGPVATYHSSPAPRLAGHSSHQSHVPYGHTYMPTPPSYAYGNYFANPYTVPWGYNWGAGYAYAAPPPTYHGVVTAAPTANPFNSAYPSQVDYNGQYPQPQIGYQSYGPQVSPGPNDPAQQGQVVAPDDKTAEGDQNSVAPQ